MHFSCYHISSFSSPTHHLSIFPLYQSFQSLTISHCSYSYHCGQRSSCSTTNFITSSAVVLNYRIITSKTTYLTVDIIYSFLSLFPTSLMNKFFVLVFHSSTIPPPPPPPIAPLSTNNRYLPLSYDVALRKMQFWLKSSLWFTTHHACFNTQIYKSQQRSNRSRVIPIHRKLFINLSSTALIDDVWRWKPTPCLWRSFVKGQIRKLLCCFNEPQFWGGVEGIFKQLTLSCVVHQKMDQRRTQYEKCSWNFPQVPRIITTCACEKMSGRDLRFSPIVQMK